MNEDPIELECADAVESSASRRALIKGAVAAGIGVAAYSAPSISKVPVYATHGLSSWTEKSDPQCVWWSPNKNSGGGSWESGFIPGGTTTTLNQNNRAASVKYTIAGQDVNIGFQGSPNNKSSDTDGAGLYDGGTGATSGPPYRGAFISIDNPDCELVVSKVACDKCSSSATDKPADWPYDHLQGSQTVQYKSNRYGSAIDGTKGDIGTSPHNRCKWSIRYIVRCRP